jgi:hypothetical protein
MPKNKSIIRQVQEALQQKLCIGEQRHIAKKQGVAPDGIYSWSTYQNYLTKGCTFVKWAKEYHGCRTLDDARNHVDAYLQKHIDGGYSPYTQKLIACALAKLYSCSTKDFIPTQVRHRANITRSRGTITDEGKIVSKAKFSESRNQEFVDFCRVTGLRRHEIKTLKPENLRYIGFYVAAKLSNHNESMKDDKPMKDNESMKDDMLPGSYILTNIKGKGGRLRDCPILSKKAVDKILNTPAGQNVWPKIPSRADVHSYRADYCKTLYKLHARPVDEIPKRDRYYCRGDLKGVVYDKRAMAIASKALGHNRISVIAGNRELFVQHG